MGKEEFIPRHSQYFFYGSMLLILLLAFFLIRSYLVTILYSLIITYIFYPLYKKIKFVFRNDLVSSLLTTILVFAIIIIPLLFVANTLINESLQTFQKVKQIDLGVFDATVAEYLGEQFDYDEQIKEMLNTFSISVARTTSDFVIGLPKKILHIFVLLFMMFYLFKDGKKIVQNVMQHIPLKQSHQRDLSQKFSDVIYASLYGIVVTAFVQGILGGIGFWIFDIPSPIMWGMIMVILSMIPFVGAWVIWFPAALYKLFSGDMFNGVGLFLFGILIVSTIDNVIRPKIVGSKARIHPIVVLLGVLGGLEVFGLLGVLIGPLVLAILGVFIELYLLERTHEHHLRINGGKS